MQVMNSLVTIAVARPSRTPIAAVVNPEKQMPHPVGVTFAPVWLVP